MPYIKPGEREFISQTLEPLLHLHLSPGQLNYVLTSLAKRFVHFQGGNYAAMNAAVGVLECCKLELYRRTVSPYEDVKIAEYGDV